MTWNGWSWRLAHSLSLARRDRNWKVGSGSKIDVHTVLKLMDDAIIATQASSGASSGSGTPSTCTDFRGSFSFDGRSANISCSSARTCAARYVSGKGSAPMSSAGAPSTIALRMASISVLMARQVSEEPEPQDPCGGLYHPVTHR